jgi:hypothetical protein
LVLTSNAATTWIACGELGSTLYQIFAASRASSGCRAKLATSMAPRHARVERAPGDLDVGLRGERGIVALQGDFAEQQIVEVRLVELLRRGLRPRLRERAARRQRYRGEQRDSREEPIRKERQEL